MGVDKDSVGVVAGLGGDVLNEQLNLPDELSTLGSLSGGSLLGFLVVNLNEFTDISRLNTLDSELSSESGLVSELSIFSMVEEIVQASVGEVLVLLVNFGENDSRHGDIRLEGSLLLGSVIRDRLGQVVSKSGGADESHDVRVVLEGQNLLLRGLIPSSRSDSNDGTLSQVGELELEGKDVPNITRGILNLKFVGVFVHLEDLEDLGDNVEIIMTGFGLLQRLVHILGDDIVTTEVAAGPLLEVAQDSNFVLLESGVLARESEGSVLANGSVVKRSSLVSGEEGPGTVLVDGAVELSGVVVETESDSVESDDITDSVNNGEVLESLGVDDNGGVVVIGGLGTRGVERRIDDLEGANVGILVGFVWESGVNNNTINMVSVGGGKADLVQVGVSVLLSGNLSLGGGFLL